MSRFKSNYRSVAIGVVESLIIAFGAVMTGCGTNDGPAVPTPPDPATETINEIAGKGWRNIAFRVTDITDSITFSELLGKSSIVREWAPSHKYITGNNDGSFTVTTYMDTDPRHISDEDGRRINTAVSTPCAQYDFTAMGSRVRIMEMRGDTLVTNETLPGYSESLKIVAAYVPMTDAELTEIRAL